MPVPVQIPSTSRRTPLVKAIDPVKFSLSRTGINDVGPDGLNLTSAGSIGQLALRVQGLINMATRRLGIASDTASIASIEDEIAVMNLQTRNNPAIHLRNKVESAKMAIAEAKAVKKSLVDVVRSQAMTDVLKTREIVSKQIPNPSLREEMLALIDDVSRISRFG